MTSIPSFTLYRFAVGLSDDDELTTLALLPAQTEDEAFRIGCALINRSASKLVAAYWQRLGEEPSSSPAKAFYTIEPVDDDEALASYAGDLWWGVANFLTP